MENVKIGVIEYAPEAYEKIKTVADKMNLSALMSQHHANQNDNKAIVEELVKMLSLAPQSLAFKMQEMSQCLVNQGMFKSSEAGMISNVLGAFAQEDLMGTRVALDKLINMDIKSVGLKTIVSSLRSSGVAQSNQQATNQAASSRDDKWKKASDIGGAVGTIVGGIIGLIVGGPGGGAAGAAVGAALGKAVVTIFKAIFGKKKDSFMAGPNGEPCTRPFLPF